MIIDKIKSDQNKTIGYILVELPITFLYETRIRFISTMAFYILAITALFIGFYFYRSRKSVVKPLEIINHETSSFLKNGRQISTELSTIKTNNEIETLAGSILKLETDLNTYIEENAKSTTEKERIQAELDLASHNQSSMLPQTFPAFPQRDEFDIYALMQPAKQVGGDFYDFFLIDEDHLGFLIGDVSDKGVPAALFMANAKTFIAASAKPGLLPDEIYKTVNSYLVNNNGGNLFITSWFGIYEISSGLLRFVSAGHESALLVLPEGRVTSLETRPNLALAVFDGISYKLHELHMKPGEKLILYTDGVTDAKNAQDEFFAKEGFIKSIEKAHDKPVSELVGLIKSDLDHFIGDALQFDDITMVAFAVNKIETKKNE